MATVEEEGAAVVARVRALLLELRVCEDRDALILPGYRAKVLEDLVAAVARFDAAATRPMG